MRISYSDDESFPGECELWQANCRRSIGSRKGQRELRALEAALLAMPNKELIQEALDDDDGGVCAIACYAKHKGIYLEKFDRDYESDEVGIAAGMPRLVAWKVVEMNDIQFDTETPRQRYEKMLAWVQEQIRK